MTTPWEPGSVNAAYYGEHLDPLRVQIVTMQRILISVYPPVGQVNRIMLTYQCPNGFHGQTVIIDALYEAASMLGVWWRANGYDLALAEGGKLTRPALTVWRLAVRLIGGAS